MKTLDEVIDKLEKADTTWSNIKNNLNYEDFRDALFYLKDYKKNQGDPDGDHQQLEKAQKLLWEFYQNDPLTWDELKGMEGKPVWVEMEGYSSHWGIVMYQDEKNGRPCLCGYDKMPIRIEINEEGEGKSWQAFRNERE